MSDRIMARSPEIWLIGGYGDVGMRTAARLVALTGQKIVIAGRDGEKATAAAALLDGQARGVALDITATAAAEALSAAGAVINFVEACPAELAAACAAAGGLFIETSADPDYLQQISDAVAALARSSPIKGLVVLSVGTSPGLTNMLARKIARDFPHTKAIDVCIEMSLGRHYGQAATEWFLRNMSGTYPARISGQWRQLAPADLSRRVRFAPDRKSVLALGYGFSDQADIARALDLPTVRTFVALYPSWITNLLRLASGTVLAGSIARQAARYARWMKKTPSFGPVRTRLAVQGSDSQGKQTGEVQLVSTDQADITAAMIVTTLECAMIAGHSGLIHSDQLVTAETALARLVREVPDTHVS